MTGGALALLQAAATVGFALSLATLVVRLIDGGRLDAEWPWLVGLVAAASVRAAAAWLWDVVGSSGAMRVKRELRGDVLDALETVPDGVPGFPSGRTATLLGPGLEALDAYFGTYLPQLVLTAIATPILVVVVWLADPLSGLVLVIVLPLIPVFMALIGMATAGVQRRQYDTLTTLSRGFLEVVGGLSTLVAFGRAGRQAGRIRAVTEDYRRRTMSVLRVTFLSGFTLEFAASLSVAIVAVSIGFRLVWGEIGLLPGLFVLLLAPEVFLPVRNVGAAFHASSAGMTASTDAFELFDAAAAASSAHVDVVSRAGRPDAADGVLLEGVNVRRGGRPVVDEVDLLARAGEVVAITGPSGAGKSSLFAAILGFVPFEGGIRVRGLPPGPAARSGLSWSPQGATLFAGSIESNVRLGLEDAEPRHAERAMRLAGVELDPRTLVGPGGLGLSGGQAQRVATARAIHRLLAGEATVLLLDEPTSAQDPAREAILARGVRELADEGATVIVATHRAALAAASDRVLDLEGARV